MNNSVKKNVIHNKMLAHVLLSMSVVLLVTKSAESGPAINHFILNKIEAIRSEMPNGLYGGPPLVPLQYDNLDIDYDRDNVTYIRFMV